VAKHRLKVALLNATLLERPKPKINPAPDSNLTPDASLNPHPCLSCFGGVKSGLVPNTTLTLTLILVVPGG